MENSRSISGHLLAACQETDVWASENLVGFTIHIEGAARVRVPVHRFLTVSGSVSQ